MEGCCISLITLQRLETSDEGTFGRIDLVGGPPFYTGELPWRDNASNISSIPPGLYRCRWTFSPRFNRPLYLVEGVEARTGVRFHPANLMGDVGQGFKAQLNGCIALGERLGWIEGQKAVLLSQPAVRKFETLLNHEDFTLEIRPCLKY